MYFVLFELQVMRHVPDTEHGLGGGSSLRSASNTHGSGEWHLFTFIFTNIELT